MIDELIPLLGLAALACATNARLGLWISLAAGFLMDPVRKLAQGQPVWMTGVVAGFVAATCVGIWLRGEGSPIAEVRARFPGLGAVLLVGIVWVLIEAARSYVLTGSLAVAVIGVLAYAAPLLAFAAGFALLRNLDEFERFARVYVVGVAVMLAAAFLTRLGVRHPILDQIGLGLQIHARGHAIDAQGGLFRGLEMAGWHATAALALLAVLATSARRRPSAGFTLLAASTLILGLFLAARRKYMVQLLLFLALWVALGWLWRRSRRVGAAVAMLAVLGGVIFASLASVPTAAERGAVDPALRRIANLEADSARIRYLTVTALGEIYVRNGFLGSGAGTGSQGAQYFGAGNNRIVGFAGEGGLGKVLGELGVPGLFLLVCVAIALTRAGLAAVTTPAPLDPEAPDVAAGVLALLASNIAVFVIAHQVFGDPFVLTTLGLLTGGLLRLAGEGDPVGDAVGDAS